MIRFPPRPLRPLEKDVARFIDFFRRLDPGFVGFSHFAAVFNRRNFEVFRIFHAIFMNGLIGKHAVFCNMIVVNAPKPDAQILNFFIRGIEIQLHFNEFIQRIFDLDEGMDFLRLFDREICPFAVLHAVSHAVNDLINRIQCAENTVFPAVFRWFLLLRNIRSLRMRNDFYFGRCRFRKSIAEQIGIFGNFRQSGHELFTLDIEIFLQIFITRQNSRSVQLAIHFAGVRELAEHMFRMLREVTVDLNSARIIGGVNPLQIAGKILPISFFQDENIGDDLRAGKGIVWQTVSLHKSRTPVRDLRHGTGFVHRGTGGQEDGVAIFLQTI